MKSRLHRIKILNFKAFREFNLDLEGRHLLVYGPNGSGKSSLYWAIYTFLQSAQKPTSGVAKYFDPTNPQNLLNIHEQDNKQPNLGEIALTLCDVGATNKETVFRISQTIHDTKKQPVVVKGNLASDFITYRFFFGFSHFRNSENLDIWPLFEKEILPFCVSTGGQSPLDMWTKIRNGTPNPTDARGLGGKTSYTTFRQRTEDFAAVLPGIVDAISLDSSFKCNG